MMTPHEPDLERLAALADGTLPAAQRCALVEHLASCADCRGVAGALTRDPSFAARRRRPVSLVPLAAGLVAVAIGGTWWIAQQREGQAAGPKTVAASSSADDRTRAGQARAIGGRQFRLEAGEWMDTAYHPASLLPERTITSSADWTRAVAAHRQLRAFAPLGDWFTVVLDGTVYRVDLRRQPR